MIPVSEEQFLIPHKNVSLFCVNAPQEIDPFKDPILAEPKEPNDDHLQSITEARQ